MDKHKIILSSVKFFQKVLKRRQFIILAKIISLIFYSLNIKGKKEIKANLKKLNIRFSIESYLYFAEFISDAVYLMENELDIKNFVVFNEHILDNAFKGKKGVMILTVHLGSWEMTGQYLVYNGYPLNVIYEAKKDWIYEHIDRIREKYGIKLIDRNRSIDAFLSVLKKNEILCVFIDQESENTSLKNVDFLGLKRRMPYGWYKLMKITGAKPVIVYTMNKHGKNYIYFHDAEKFGYYDYFKFFEKIIKVKIFQYNLYDRIWKDYNN